MSTESHTFAVRWETDLPAELGGGRVCVVAADAHDAVVEEVRERAERRRLDTVGFNAFTVEELTLLALALWTLRDEGRVGAALVDRFRGLKSRVEGALQDRAVEAQAALDAALDQVVDDD